MAKKTRTVNKSQEVRDYLTENPGDGPSVVSEVLGKRGIAVSPNFVSNIKLKMKKANGQPPKKRGRRPKSASVAATPNGNGYSHLVAAAQFIRICGGIQPAKEALSVASKVLDAGA